MIEQCKTRLLEVEQCNTRLLEVYQERYCKDPQVRSLENAEKLG